MERLKWNIGLEEYYSNEHIVNRSMWLYTDEQHPVEDRNKNEYKISQIAADNFVLLIGTFCPHNKIIFERSYDTLRSAQKYGEMLYLLSK